MIQRQDRKEKEIELHDHLRSDLSDDRRYTSNIKFYSITQSNRDYVNKWLADRCEGKKVLDYCCGNGDVSIRLAEARAHVYGIDISPVSIQNATSEAVRKGLDDRVTFCVMDAEATEFTNDYFDFVVVNGVLHHLDLGKAYRELARILKPEGIVIATEALRHNVFIHLYRKMTPHLRTAWETQHILGKEEIEMARQYFNGVEVVKFFHLATIGAVPFRNLHFFDLMRRILGAVDSILLRLPVIKWQAWMAVFTLSHPKKLGINLI
jgi:ubiquinone/menaquinone biosynthesis C-methylase UbiE